MTKFLEEIAKALLDKTTQSNTSIKRCLILVSRDARVFHEVKNSRKKRKQRLIDSNMINSKKRSYHEQQKHDGMICLIRSIKKLGVLKTAATPRRPFLLPRADAIADNPACQFVMRKFFLIFFIMRIKLIIHIMLLCKESGRTKFILFRSAHLLRKCADLNSYEIYSLTIK